MGRERIKYDRVQLHIFILAAIDKRLKKYEGEFGWTKTRIVEDALTVWLNERDKEAKHGLAETKQ